MITPTQEQIDASRARLGIPEDWVWKPCANDCGDIVWVPDLGEVDVPVKAACSAQCASALIQSLGGRPE